MTTSHTGLAAVPAAYREALEARTLLAGRPGIIALPAMSVFDYLDRSGADDGDCDIQVWARVLTVLAFALLFLWSWIAIGVMATSSAATTCPVGGKRFG
jgi:hypothetical protein